MIRIISLTPDDAGTRKIFIGWSNRLASGGQFEHDPLISPAAGEGGRTYTFYEAGQRGNTNIAVARTG